MNFFFLRHVCFNTLSCRTLFFTCRSRKPFSENDRNIQPKIKDQKKNIVCMCPYAEKFSFCILLYQKVISVNNVAKQEYKTNLNDLLQLASKEYLPPFFITYIKS